MAGYAKRRYRHDDDDADPYAPCTATLYCQMRKVLSEEQLTRYLLLEGSKQTSWTESSWPSRFMMKIFWSTSKSFTEASPEAIANTFPDLSQEAEFAGC